MYLDQLLEITDVTDSVNARRAGGATAERSRGERCATPRSAASSSTARGGADDVHCQVVPMYAGGQYKLYRFRHYTEACGWCSRWRADGVLRR